MPVSDDTGERPCASVSGKWSTAAAAANGSAGGAAPIRDSAAQRCGIGTAVAPSPSSEVSATVGSRADADASALPAPEPTSVRGDALRSTLCRGCRLRVASGGTLAAAACCAPAGSASAVPAALRNWEARCVARRLARAAATDARAASSSAFLRSSAPFCRRAAPSVVSSSTGHAPVHACCSTRVPGQR